MLGRRGPLRLGSGAGQLIRSAPPAHLTPINVSMDVTETIRRLGNPRELVVTVAAARRTDPDRAEGVLRFERLTALAYQ